MSIDRFGLDERTIEQRAYALWEQRGRPLGSPQTDWDEATRELRNEISIAEDASEPPFSSCRMEPEEL
jgi:hypothetical protein